MVGESKRRKRIDPLKPEETAMAATPPATPLVTSTLTMDDVNALLASYQRQITQQASQIATQAMLIARHERALKK